MRIYESVLASSQDEPSARSVVKWQERLDSQKADLGARAKAAARLWMIVVATFCSCELRAVVLLRHS